MCKYVRKPLRLGQGAFCTELPIFLGLTEQPCSPSMHHQPIFLRPTSFRPVPFPPFPPGTLRQTGAGSSHSSGCCFLGRFSGCASPWAAAGWGLVEQTCKKRDAGKVWTRLRHSLLAIFAVAQIKYNCLRNSTELWTTERKPHLIPHSFKGLSTAHTLQVAWKTGNQSHLHIRAEFIPSLG